MLKVGFIFFVTLAVFPAIAANVQSQHDTEECASAETAGDSLSKTCFYGAKLFIPIYCFIGFNVADLLGRTLAGAAQVRLSFQLMP